MVTVVRGDVILCDLNPVVGTEQAGIRPALVVQIDRANTVSPHTIIAPFTTRIRRAVLPSHALIPRYRWVNPRFRRALRADAGDR